MILRARIVVTMEGAPIESGAVAVESEQIVDVGKFGEVRARKSGTVVDLGEQVLLPGLINAHCHLDYTWLRGKIPPQKSFADWVRAIIAQKERLSPQDYVASINEGFAEAKKFGTTAIANLTAFPELIAQIRPPIRTWWFGELIDLRSPQRSNEFVDLASNALKSAQNWGLAPHAPFTASENLYRRCEEIAHRENALLTTHLAESREEMEMFAHSRGLLADFLAGIGRDPSDLHHVTPIEHLSEFCNFDDRWLLVHLNEVSLHDLEFLVQRKTLPTIVHCPRSHEYFGHSPFRIGKFGKLGLNICLGTDSLASNETLSLFAEMRALQRSHEKLWPREILEMVTINAARALHAGTRLGRIAPGYAADLIAITPDSGGDAFEQILGFDGAVDWMMLGGEVQ